MVSPACMCRGKDTVGSERGESKILEAIVGRKKSESEASAYASGCAVSPFVVLVLHYITPTHTVRAVKGL